MPFTSAEHLGETDAHQTVIVDDQNSDHVLSPKLNCWSPCSRQGENQTMPGYTALDKARLADSHAVPRTFHFAMAP